MIIDTNALSAWAERDDELLDLLPEPGALELPVITVGEYLWGLSRSRNRQALERWLAGVIVATRVLAVTLATAEAYAVVRENVHSKGKPIPANDTWIAALALQHQLPVLSRDTHYDFVDGIQRVTW